MISKRRFDTEFVDGGDDAADVVAEHFAECFVDHAYVAGGAHGVPLDGYELEVHSGSRGKGETERLGLPVREVRTRVDPPRSDGGDHATRLPQVQVALLGSAPEGDSEAALSRQRSPAEVYWQRFKNQALSGHRLVTGRGRGQVEGADVTGALCALWRREWDSNPRGGVTHDPPAGHRWRQVFYHGVLRVRCDVCGRFSESAPEACDGGR